MANMKAVKKHKAFTVPEDAVYYYKHEVKAESRLLVEQLLIGQLKKTFQPFTHNVNNESFYIKSVGDLEVAREILVEMAMFLEEK